MQKLTYIFLFSFLSQLSGFGQNVKINNVKVREVYSEGFLLQKDTNLKIRARISSSVSNDNDIKSDYSGSVWILNSSTGEVVYKMDSEEADSPEKLRDLEDQVQLKKGNYELYLSTYPKFKRLVINNSKGKWDRLVELGQIWANSGILLNDAMNKDLKNWFVEIKSTDLRSQFVEPVRIFKNEFLTYKAAKNSDSYKQAFEVNRRVKVRVICQGEGMNGSMYDYGVIKNIDSRKIVWEMKYEDSSPAGGAEKNRKMDEAIELEPGRYELIYSTDDSHSFDDWNEEPPYDPHFWGIALMLIDENGKNSVRTIVAKELPMIVDFSKVTDNKVLKKTFRIKQSVKVNIYAVGEGTSRGMADHGWLEDIETHERVWDMDYWETEHAGGAEKNRVSDEILTLKPGVYIAYYVTDDSHAFGDWNSSKPTSPEDWGLKIRLLDSGNISDYVEYITSYKSPNVLVDITPVGDDAYEVEDLVISSPTRVRIIALGEGDGEEMYDYGWIENEETGEIVWEMTYRKSKHAGGAEKNRKIQQTIMLNKGNYKVYYKSDGSHSFPSWNSSPPDDPLSWGIRILKNEGN